MPDRPTRRTARAIPADPVEVHAPDRPTRSKFTRQTGRSSPVGPVGRNPPPDPGLNHGVEGFGLADQAGTRQVYTEGSTIRLKELSGQPKRQESPWPPAYRSETTRGRSAARRRRSRLRDDETSPRLPPGPACSAWGRPCTVKCFPRLRETRSPPSRRARGLPVDRAGERLPRGPDRRRVRHRGGGRTRRRHVPRLQPRSGGARSAASSCGG